MFTLTSELTTIFRSPRDIYSELTGCLQVVCSVFITQFARFFCDDGWLIHIYISNLHMADVVGFVHTIRNVEINILTFDRLEYRLRFSALYELSTRKTLQVMSKYGDFVCFT